MKLDELLPHDFNDPALAAASLEQHSELGQRLEWLGDRVLGICVAYELYNALPQLGEEGLTRAYSNLTSNKCLRELGKELEAAVLQQPRCAGKTHADLIESYLAAIMLDGGIEAALTGVRHMYGELISNPDPVLWQRDAKTLLKEICEKRHEETPKYLVSEDENRRFNAVCTALGLEGNGAGVTHSEAEQRAASKILVALGLS